MEREGLRIRFIVKGEEGVVHFDLLGKGCVSGMGEDRWAVVWCGWVALLDVVFDLIGVCAAADKDFFYTGHGEELKCVLDQWYVRKG